MHSLAADVGQGATEAHHDVEELIRELKRSTMSPRRRPHLTPVVAMLVELVVVGPRVPARVRAPSPATLSVRSRPSVSCSTAAASTGESRRNPDGGRRGVLPRSSGSGRSAPRSSSSTETTTESFELLTAGRASPTCRLRRRCSPCSAGTTTAIRRQLGHHGEPERLGATLNGPNQIVTPPPRRSSIASQGPKGRPCAPPDHASRRGKRLAGGC